MLAEPSFGLWIEYDRSIGVCLYHGVGGPSSSVASAFELGGRLVESVLERRGRRLGHQSQSTRAKSGQQDRECRGQVNERKDHKQARSCSME